MDTKDLLHINDFSGGMNTDTSDGAIAGKQYRMAKNLRYVTNTQENSGELHMIEGVGEAIGTNKKVIASTQIRNIGVFVYETSTGWGVCTFKPSTKEITNVCNIQGTDRIVGLKLSLVTSYEDNNNCKLYIADGKGPIIVVNLFSGKIYSNIEEVESYPSVTFTVPIYCGLIDGALKGGVYSYSYQLYSKYSSQSEISPSTKLIPLRKGKNEGYRSDENTQCGIKIKIPYNDTFDKFDKIRIFRVRYPEVGLLPTIEIAYEGNIQLDFYFEDTGTQSLSILSLEEYNSMTGIHIIPKTIESKDGYLFAANIKTDNPIYAFDSVKNWKPDANIELVYAKIAIDDCNVKNRIESNDLTQMQIPTIQGSTTPSNKQVALGVEWENNEKSSYTNTKVSYALKSLRRGETYRFGVILYDEKGNSSAVFHLKDVDVPEGLAWNVENNTLYANPCGIKITINNLPAEAVAYEIVRCNRGISDIKNICQGIISRPISRYWTEYETLDTISPLTPSGFMTTNDIFAGILLRDPHTFTDIGELISWNILSGIYRDDDDNTNFIYKTWCATNAKSGYVDNFDAGVSANVNVFLFASPEYSYLADSTSDLLKSYDTSLSSISAIRPSFIGDSVRATYYMNWLPLPSRTEWCDFRKIGDGSVAIPYVNTGQSQFIYLSPYWTAPYFAYFDPNEASFANATNETEIPSNWENRMLYIKQYDNYSNTDADRRTVEIGQVGFPETLLWDDYAEPDAPYNLKYIGKQIAVGNVNYVNWVCGGQYNQGVLEYEQSDRLNKIEDSLKKLCSHGEDDWKRFCGGLEGPGGKCFVIQLKNNVNSFILNGTDDLLGTYICNIKKNAVPYGGTSQLAINNSTYYSYGDYFIKGVTDSLAGGSNSVIVFDGDTFIEPFEYVSMHKFWHNAIWYPRNFFIVYSIPVETSINLAYTYGAEYSKNYNSTGNITYTLNNPASIANKFVQSEPLYAYNSAYSTNMTQKQSVSIDMEDYDFDVNLDYRIYHSLLKSNNEYVDNWLKFQPANFLDVDTRKGPITGLRRFHNKLVFWQSEATGIFSVNERTTITDDSNLPLILGTGGVLARYDYLPTSNGMKLNEYCDAQSDNVLYWWDHNKGEICAYQDNEGILPLSKVKFVLNYVNKIMEDGKDVSDPVVSFDKNFNEAVFTISDESLVYNEHIGLFTSVYEIEPKCYMNVLDDIYYIDKDDNSNIYKWNGGDKLNVNGFGKQLTPYVKFIINSQPTYTKVFDNGEISGRLYGGDNLDPITLKFNTPLKQHSVLDGSQIENREYNFRYIVPRNLEDGEYPLYGGRLRGKFMQQELESTSNSYDFSLLYIATKFRISWS